MELKKILVIAAHPDDEVLGCGGLIRLLANRGCECSVLILTGGSDTRYPKEMEDVLRNNAKEANEILGTTKLFFEYLPNQQLDAIPLTTVIQTIEKYTLDIKPDALFTHHGGDLNKDHKVVYEASATAARPAPEQSIKQLFTYYVASSTDWNAVIGERTFIPNTFIDIEEVFEAKQKAMIAYSSECRAWPHPRSPEALEAYARFWGLSSGMICAEPYQLLRSTEIFS